MFARWDYKTPFWWKSEIPLFIFDVSTAPAAAAGCRPRMKLYSFRIYEYDQLVRVFVPCVRDDGECGLFELFTKKFHGNAAALGAFYNAVSAAPGCAIDLDGTIPGGYVLKDRCTYRVAEDDVTITATEPGQSALVVPEGASVVLEMPEGRTLTVIGANASDAVPAGAGIEVPFKSRLTILGGGTLVAQGGNAAGGSSGAVGGDPQM